MGTNSVTQLYHYNIFKTEDMRSFWLLSVPKAVNGYCVTWLASIFFLLPHIVLMSYTPDTADTGSLRINCLLISYLISKQARLHDFKGVLVHFNLNVIGKKTCAFKYIINLFISSRNPLPQRNILLEKSVAWRSKRDLLDSRTKTTRGRDLT